MVSGISLSLVRLLAPLPSYDDTMRFASTNIVRSANQVAVEGDLTIKGVTRPVRADGIVLGTTPVFHYPTKTTHEHFGLDAQVTIDRREFNLSFNNEMPSGLLNLG